MMHPKHAEHPHADSMFIKLAPLMGAVLALVGIGLLWKVVADRRRARLVTAMKEHGPVDPVDTGEGDDVWVRGAVVDRDRVKGPFDDTEYLAWRLHASHLVKVKISNDAGVGEERQDLWFETKGGDIHLRSAKGTAVLDIDNCDYRLMDCDEYDPEDLPEPVLAWMNQKNIDPSTEGLEMALYYVPIAAEIDMIGRVTSIQNGVRRLDDSGPTGLALSLQGLDGYIARLQRGSVTVAAIGIACVVAGIGLAGAGLFGR